MISVSESYAERHHIIFNPTKLKLLCYNVDPSSLGSIYLNNQSISIVSYDKHLGNYITLGYRRIQTTNNSTSSIL